MDKIKKITKLLKKINHVFCTGMTCKVNMKRDVIIISAMVFFSAAFILGDRFLLEKRIKAENVVAVQKEDSILTEQEIYEEVASVQEEIDISNWSNYSSDWYGFEVNYPDSWKKPLGKTAAKSSKWEYRYQFRRPETEPEKIYTGFDFIMYDVAKVKELSGIDEFPKIKNTELIEDSKCANIEGHLIETGDYPAEEIYLPPTDECFNTALFFSFISGRYIYVILPVLKTEQDNSIDPRLQLEEDFPEFLSIISTASIKEIIRPKVSAVPAKPKITAPRPASYKVDATGRLVCAKKNDKPAKSDKNKKRHLDMECCLDPDETPNPWCYYPVEKYGKYLGK